MRTDWKRNTTVKFIFCIVVFFTLLNLHCVKKEDTPLSVALKIAQSERDESERTDLLSFIIIHLAYSGEFDNALSLVSTIVDTTEKDRCYNTIIFAYFDSSYDDKAIQMLDSIKNNREKAFTLNMIAAHYARSDSIDKAEMFLEQSLTVTKTIEDYRSRAQALVYIAGSYQFIKNDNQALVILSEAVKAIDMAPDTNWMKVSTMVDITGKYIEFGKKEKAKSLLHRARQITESNIPDYFRDLRMADIAKKYASMGMCRTAIEIAESIKVFDQKDRALSYIAISYIEDERIGEAKQIAMTIENPYWSGEVAKAMANKYIERGNYANAGNIIQAIKDPAAQTEGYCWLAYRYKEMNQHEKAMESLNAARAVIKTAENDRWKSCALTTIADTYVEIEEPDSALNFLLQSRSVASTLEDGHDKSLCLFGVVERFIMMNKLHLALETTTLIISPYLKISALIHIQQVYNTTNVETDENAKQFLQKIVDDIGKKPIKPKKPRVYRSGSRKMRW